MSKKSKEKEAVVGIKKKLSVKDRLTLSGLLPLEGNIINLTLCRDIRTKIELGQAEIDKINLKTEGQGLVWDVDKAKEKTIEFTGAEIEFLKTRINELDKQKKIKSNMLSLCLMIREISNV